jgi:DNA-binding transcriptional LysR family regulator
VERACLVVRRQHPLASRREVAIADLIEFEWVMQPPGSLLNRTVERLFLSAGVPLPDKIVSTSSLLMTMMMVQETDAIAPIAYEVAAPFVDGHGVKSLVILPLEEQINVQPFSLITLRGRQLSPAARTMFQAVSNEIDRLKG